jgi:hypothetical protein
MPGYVILSEAGRLFEEDGEIISIKGSIASVFWNASHQMQPNSNVIKIHVPTTRHTYYRISAFFGL